MHQCSNGSSSIEVETLTSFSLPSPADAGKVNFETPMSFSFPPLAYATGINSADPLFIICEHERTQRPLEPVAIPGLATTPFCCHQDEFFS
jgi:hypothetical protein